MVRRARSCPCGGGIPGTSGQPRIQRHHISSWARIRHCGTPGKGCTWTYSCRLRGRTSHIACYWAFGHTSAHRPRNTERRRGLLLNSARPPGRRIRICRFGSVRISRCCMAASTRRARHRSGNTQSRGSARLLDIRRSLGRKSYRQHCRGIRRRHCPLAGSPSQRWPPDPSAGPTRHGGGRRRTRARESVRRSVEHPPLRPSLASTPTDGAPVGRHESSAYTASRFGTTLASIS